LIRELKKTEATKDIILKKKNNEKYNKACERASEGAMATSPTKRVVYIFLELD